jgi:hypothetical protein
MSDVPIPAADEVDVRLRWQTVSDGALDGLLEVRNIGPRPIRVGGKPLVTPLGVDGRPLAADFLVTAELRIPPHLDLLPGQRAAAPVSWSGWNGPPSSGRVRVEFEGVTVDVVADGPAQPASTEEPTNLSSSWFDLLAD